MNTIPSNEQQKSYKVLYIEDDIHCIELMRFSIGRMQHIEVYTCETATEAIFLANSHHPEIIIIDLNLRGKDGSTVFTELQQASALGDSTTIALSAWASREKIDEILALGFDTFIEKPITRAKLSAYL